ncbi:MAG: FAD-dependent oxidoreductase [Candidatus Cloacimonadaceae bacterium]|jgi:NADPH-dependent 2,4-dienoyl-CoA reductase/sulfur reductase-like enzyme/peroxiredoxin family protein/rhodanese-related sulfurtransferase/TusA-related sulfurtransferase|nr:FAD-dependent oxidoreductase [Candidatus Cloacimonadota bacterium]MDY0127138.1 FAD-dependent oxidoreductase [Candidatus Cloacimonadaceae bacterium]MCB5254365.1 FAD-dependent oxidoreductase [Candidatus Cloacimonadota bacterium]MCK9178279.1 FAD-dependent oxidoreductase [Candidatus Cloacimonadota bacterium]MCK9243223.1 FAD-dependent oxidoreductase [Candidatus Cloacimonadota bacterium]
MPKYLIVGGVAGGATTAARLRRLDENAEIIMFERGKYISYANCGLPYYVGGVIADRDRLFVQTPDSFHARLNVDVRIQEEVMSIDRKAKTVLVQKADGTQYSESYDKLVLSPGAEPLRPPIPGIQDEVIFTLRNVPDIDRIKDYITQHNVRHSVIVGAGFIGLEMAENLHHLGIKVTIVEMAEQVMTPLDYEMAAAVHQHLKTKNVEFYLKDGVSSFVREKDGLQVRLKSGRSLPTDMVILSIGVRPDSKLAEEAGLDLGINKGIRVNEYLQTSDEDIYALGDAIVYPNPITNEECHTYLAGPANRQGRLVADNIVRGNVREYQGSIATAIAKVFDLTVGATGISEKVLRKSSIPYVSSIIHASSHAGYYPDALPMTLKIVFSPDTGKLLGGQIVGFKGVDKRTDMLANILKCGGTIYDMQEIEHAYAPPYSSAKDPVNIAGLVAENIMRKVVRIVHWDEIRNLNMKDVVLIDVRTPEEVALGSLEGQINLPVDELRQRLDEIPKNKKIIVFCGTGARSYIGARILMQSGFDEVYNLSGGYITYETATQKQSNEDIFFGDYVGKDDHIYQGKNPCAPLDKANRIEVDACGLQCPGPIMKLKQEIDRIDDGDILIISASDPGFAKDVESWCNMTNNRLLELKTKDNKIIATVQKCDCDKLKTSSVEIGTKNKTLIVFSDDLDRALASFVIANGAAATGSKVTMFFTFWGLNVIKKPGLPKTDKDIMSKIFGMMLPKNSQGLGLSKINFAGMGPAMMRKRMKDKNVDSLETMIMQAKRAGVQMIACQMSMDIMGVDASELLEGVTIGGVATYLEEAEKSNVNLFI